jgi:ADP-ribose pyrophosphatase YjhB (NUDIX family)
MTKLRQTSLCFLLKDKQILLAMKKRGFGQGKWNGYGGKPKQDETILKTALRETQEEINVIPKKLKKVAILDFYFKNKPEWNQQVVVFLCHNWEGKPTETEEMKPKWFNLDKIPYQSMWPDDLFWLPKILSNKKIKARFLFDKNDVILEKKIKN